MITYCLMLVFIDRQNVLIVKIFFVKIVCIFSNFLKLSQKIAQTVPWQQNCYWTICESNILDDYLLSHNSFHGPPTIPPYPWLFTWCLATVATSRQMFCVCVWNLLNNLKSIFFHPLVQRRPKGGAEASRPPSQPPLQLVRERSKQ
jgi:hypothetical protein